jgi:sortase A
LAYSGYNGGNEQPGNNLATVTMQRRDLLFFLLTLVGGTSCAGRRNSSAAAQTLAQPPTPPPHAPLGEAAGAQGYLPDRIAIPAIDLDTPVVELGWSSNTTNSGAIFSEWDVAAYAAGWHKNSALLSDNSINGGNVVMSGHNNILGAIFRELDQLKRNDTITVWSGERSFLYAVDKVLIVPEKYATLDQRRANAAWIGPTAAPQLTLVSCWPRDDNTHRIIVVAHPLA